MQLSGPHISEFRATADRSPDLKWYAIADAAQEIQLPSVLLTSSRQIACLFGGSQGTQLARHSPHLVELSSPTCSDSAWSWIERNAALTPCLSIIATSKPFAALFDQLQACIQVMLPDAETMYFAFWDCAILGTLFGQEDDDSLHVPGPVLTPQQQLKLTEGMAKWWYWDRLSRRQGISLNLDEYETPNGLITLTQKQVDDLVEASVPDHVLHYVVLNKGHLIREVPLCERYAFVRKSILRAREYGLVSMRDLVDYVCVELLYKEKMSSDVLIRDLLACVKAGKIEFREALSLFH